MQTTSHPTPGLTPSQAAQREQQVRRWITRVLELTHVSGCDIKIAIAAIEAADRETTRTH